MKNYFFTCTLFFTALLAGAQPTFTWNGKRAAVVLTYDDGLSIHLSEVVPALDSFGLKGTFYLSDHLNGLKDQIPGWKKAAANGHELANHTLWHPCEGGRTGREFVKEYDLRFYTVKRMTDEIRALNNLLKAMDGKEARTFAFPCGDTRINDTAYIDPLRTELVAARGVQAAMPGIGEVDLYHFPSYVMNGETSDQMIALVKKAMEKKALLVFLFHGVGGEHSLNVSSAEHRKLLAFLQQKQNEVWVAPMIEVARKIQLYQTKK